MAAHNQGVVEQAWWNAYLYALTKTKDKFPKSPDQILKEPPSGDDATEMLVAGAKARLRAQDMNARLKRLGKERVIHREE